MQRPVMSLAFAGMLAVSACGVLQSGQQSEPVPSSDGGYEDTGYGSSSRVAETACRDEIVRRWHMPESRVHTTGRSTNSDGVTLVNWEIEDGGAGYCRVDVNGNVSELKVERNRDERTGNYENDGYGDNGGLDDSGGLGSREVRTSQVRACRDEVVSRFNVRPSDVGISAGERDDRGMAYIEWSIQDGRSGTCLVDDQDVLVRFRTR